MQRNAHLVMSARTQGAVSLYPAVGTVAGDLYGATTVAASSSLATGRRCRIFEIAIGDGTGDQWVLEDHDGQFIARFSYVSAGTSYKFGPEGIQLTNGFRMTTTTGDDMHVVYEID